MSNKMLKALAVMLLAAAGGSAVGADLSPAYVGADVGTQFSQNTSLVRAYAGYKLGGNTLFGLQQTHGVELMVFTLGTETKTLRYVDYGYTGGNPVRANGIGINWSTALRLDDTWSLTGRLGGNYTWAAASYRGDSGKDTYARGGVTADLGLAYKLNPHVSLTVDVSYMPIRLNRVEKNTRPTLGTGLRYDF